jgi:FkbM family methyltransferase
MKTLFHSLSRLAVEAFRPLHFRGKTRLFRQIAPNHGIERIRLFGAEVELDLSDPMEWLIYIADYEPWETAMVRKHLQPGSVFVDAGACLGYYSLLAASRVGPSGRVIAYEPSPSVYQRLVQILNANHLENIQAFPIGLADHDGELPLYLPAGNPGGVASMVGGGGGSAPISVQVLSLDEHLKELGIERVDLLKVDCEGFEPKILAGARQLIAAGGIRAILCEFNDKALQDTGSSSRELYDSLQAMGFADSQNRPLRTDRWLENRLLLYRG